MRCMACGAEMILTNVVQDDTMGVPGFEHQTFMCSECHDLERRLIFTKQDRDGDGEPMPEQVAPSVAPASTVHEEHVAVIDPAENVLVESTQIAPLELTQTAPVKTTVQVETSQLEPTIQNRDPEPVLQQAPPPVLPASTSQDEQVVASGLLSNAQGPTQTVSVEPIQAAPLEVTQTASVRAAAPIQATETVAVETTQTVAVQPIQNRQPAWAKTLEKLHPLNRRPANPRGAADEVERCAEFNRFWDSLLSVPSPSTSSEELSCDKAEQPIASPAPTARDEPSCGGTLAQLADCVTPDTERAGIANSVKQLSPSTEPLSRVTPDEPVQSLKEPIASPAPTARDEPSGAEERPERSRRWWSWRKLVR
jgi:hypothetical protein